MRSVSQRLITLIETVGPIETDKDDEALCIGCAKNHLTMTNTGLMADPALHDEPIDGRVPLIDGPTISCLCQRRPGALDSVTDGREGVRRHGTLVTPV